MWKVHLKSIRILHYSLVVQTKKKKITKIRASQNNTVPWYFLCYYSIIYPISFLLKNPGCNSLNWFHYPLKGHDPLFQKSLLHLDAKVFSRSSMKDRNGFLLWVLDDILLRSKENHNLYHGQSMLNISVFLEVLVQRVEVISDFELCIWNTFLRFIFAASKGR